jgi:hypothetical protein
LSITAHGNNGKSKRVRLRLLLASSTVTWVTEGKVAALFAPPKKKLHAISFADIMHIESGKKTAAFMRACVADVSATCCFSLLTKSGSLGE